jgi:hypothetical protein
VGQLHPDAPADRRVGHLAAHRRRGTHDWIGAVVGITTWLVFVVDYVVHARHLGHYGRTGLGRFDLFVVIATAP